MAKAKKRRKADEIEEPKMDADGYRAALEQLQLSQLAAGKLFGVGARTSRRWALNEARIPIAVSILLDLLVNKQLKLTVPMLDEDGRRIEGKERIWTLSAKGQITSHAA